MPAKVESHGIDKHILIKYHKQILESLNLPLTDEQIRNFTEYSKVNSQVLLFGIEDLKENNEISLAVLENFDEDYNGLDSIININHLTRSYSDFSSFVVLQLQKAENYFKRALKIKESETDKEFLDIISSFELFLQTEFTKSLLPELKNIQEQIKKEIAKLYDSDLSEEEVVDKANKLLDEIEKQSTDLFDTKIQDTLNGEAIKNALLLLAGLGFEKLADSEVAKAEKNMRYQYRSNIQAFFFNEIRRLRETIVDNVFFGTNKRSLATDQLQEFKFNLNVFKLSVLTHPRALFRAITSFGSNTEYYKAMVPRFVLPNLDPNGQTVSILFLIKTKLEWAVSKGLQNVNVVDGMSLHHNDQIYYKPVKSLADEPLAKEQRKEFISSLKQP
jgi:tetratricopeptide (TPR) repeat protein